MEYLIQPVDLRDFLLWKGLGIVARYGQAPERGREGEGEGEVVTGAQDGEFCYVRWEGWEREGGVEDELAEGEGEGERKRVVEEIAKD